MIRREEINQQAEEYRQPYRDGGYRLSSKDVRDAFEEGAEWADKTMIDKVCDWIQCMALDYITGDITDVKWESMFADLRKYVENGDN